MQWGSNNKRRTNMIVPISENGARQIFNQVRRVNHIGGTEPEYALAEANRYWTGQKMLSKQQFQFLQTTAKNVLKIILFL